MGIQRDMSYAVTLVISLISRSWVSEAAITRVQLPPGTCQSVLIGSSQSERAVYSVASAWLPSIHSISQFSQRNETGLCSLTAVSQSLPQSAHQFALASYSADMKHASDCADVRDGYPTAASYGQNVTMQFAPILSPQTLYQEYTTCSETTWVRSKAWFGMSKAGPHHTWIFLYNPCPVLEAIVLLNITKSDRSPDEYCNALETQNTAESRLTIITILNAVAVTMLCILAMTVVHSYSPDTSHQQENGPCYNGCTFRDALLPGADNRRNADRPVWNVSSSWHLLLWPLVTAFLSAHGQMHLPSFDRVDMLDPRATSFRYSWSVNVTKSLYYHGIAQFAIAVLVCMANTLPVLGFCNLNQARHVQDKRLRYKKLIAALLLFFSDVSIISISFDAWMNFSHWTHRVSFLWIQAGIIISLVLTHAAFLCNIVQSSATRDVHPSPRLAFVPPSTSSAQQLPSVFNACEGNGTASTPSETDSDRQTPSEGSSHGSAEERAGDSNLSRSQESTAVAINIGDTCDSPASAYVSGSLPSEGTLPTHTPMCNLESPGTATQTPLLMGNRDAVHELDSPCSSREPCTPGGPLHKRPRYRSPRHTSNFKLPESDRSSPGILTPEADVVHVNHVNHAMMFDPDGNLPCGSNSSELITPKNKWLSWSAVTEEYSFRYPAEFLAALIVAAITLASGFTYSLGVIQELAECTRGDTTCLENVEIWMYKHVFQRSPRFPDLQAVPDSSASLCPEAYPPATFLRQAGFSGTSENEYELNPACDRAQRSLEVLQDQPAKLPEWLADAHFSISFGGSFALAIAYFLGMKTILRCASTYKRISSQMRSASRSPVSRSAGYSGAQAAEQKLLDDLQSASMGHSVYFFGILVSTCLVQIWSVATMVGIIIVPLLHRGFWIYIAGYYWTWIVTAIGLVIWHCFSQHLIQTRMLAPTAKRRPMAWCLIYLLLSMLYFMVGVLIAIWRLFVRVYTSLFAVSILDENLLTMLKGHDRGYASFIAISALSMPGSEHQPMGMGTVHSPNSASTFQLQRRRGNVEEAR